MDSHRRDTAGGGSEEPGAYYLPRGNRRYEPTRATESPWDRTAQHGGPPAALLAYVIDQTVEGPLRIGRISVDILGPIPLREAVVEVSVIKPGRRVHLTEARMIVDGRVAVTGRAWHIATGDHPPTTGGGSLRRHRCRRGRQPSLFIRAWTTGVTDVRSSGGSLAEASTALVRRMYGRGSACRWLLAWH
jgi:hypothetical protein